MRSICGTYNPSSSGADALQNHPAGRVPQHTLRALAESRRRGVLPTHGARQWGEEHDQDGGVTVAIDLRDGTITFGEE